MGGTEGRAASRRQWGDAAERWARAAEEEETGAPARATEWMLDSAQLQPGERVLELACGAGRVGFEAAQIVGPEGLVVCSDFAEPMVEAVDARIERLQPGNIRAQVLDAESLDLHAEFDALLCRTGYMLMSDPAQALAESYAALRPGGRLVHAVWASAEKNPWLSTLTGAVMAKLNAPPPEPGTPGPFALSDHDHLLQLMKKANFERISIVEISGSQSYASLDSWWDRMRGESGPLAAVFNALHEDEVGAIRRLAFAQGARFVGSDGSVDFPAAYVGAIGYRP